MSTQPVRRVAYNRYNGYAAVVEATIDYRRVDRHAVTLPCTSILHQYQGEIDDLRIYMDIGPLYAGA